MGDNSINARSMYTETTARAARPAAVGAPSRSRTAPSDSDMRTSEEEEEGAHLVTSHILCTCEVRTCGQFVRLYATKGYRYRYDSRSSKLSTYTAKERNLGGYRCQCPWDP